MARYNVTIDLRKMRDRLHEIEAGNAIRHYHVPTLAAAVMLCNVARITAGLAMRQGPRSIKPGHCAHMAYGADFMFLEIARLKD